MKTLYKTFLTVLFIGISFVHAENLLKNSSFEEPLQNGRISHWNNAVYGAGILSDEHAYDGKFSLKMIGEGTKYIGMRQRIDPGKLNNGGKLQVSVMLYVDNYVQGVLKPIHFILKADGKVRYPQGVIWQYGKYPQKKWVKVSSVLDLDPYEKVEFLEVYTIGWDWNKKYFKGVYFIDNFEAIIKD